MSSTAALGPNAPMKKKDLIKDLRATHYELGHDGRGDFKSIYIKDYPEWPLDQQNQTISSNMLRKTHFVPGVDDQANRFMSMYKEDYIKHPGNHQGELNEANLKDLRNHHFKYGFDKHAPFDTTSEHHWEYVKKQVPDVDRENQKKMKELVSSSVSLS